MSFHGEVLAAARGKRIINIEQDDEEQVKITLDNGFALEITSGAPGIEGDESWVDVTVVQADEPKRREPPMPNWLKTAPPPGILGYDFLGRPI